MGYIGVMTRREAVAGVLGALGAGMSMPAAAKPRRAALGSRGLSLSAAGDCKWKQLLKQTVEQTWTTQEDLDWDFLESIGYYAFYKCEFRNIVLPNVVTMGERCFYSGTITGDTISMPKLISAPKPHAFGNGNFYSEAQTWTGTTATTIKIAGYNMGNTSRQGRCRYYNVRIWQGADLVRDFVPVRIGEVGYMYDVVSGDMFGNSGSSGQIVPGPDKEDQQS